MSEENKNTQSKKLEPEGRPPLKSRSMVSEEDLLIKEAAEKTKKGESVEIPDEKVLLLFIGETLYDIRGQLNELLGYFRNVGKFESASQKLAQLQEKQKPQVKKEPTKTEPKKVVESSSPLEIADSETRLKEVTEAISGFSSNVTISVDDAMFIVVKPNGYLKTEWPDINEAVKNLSGTWISQGKESHWKIPKIVKKTETSKPQQQSRPKPEGPPTGVESVKLLFTKYLEDLLTFSEENGNVIIKPKQFLGTENFTKIASVVREAGGEYVSAGANSHFKIPIGSKK